MDLRNKVVAMVENALPGVHIWPLFLDAENGLWVIRAKFEPGITLPKHFHTGTVHFYTTAGSWHYAEYPDQPQTAGSYLYEPGGSVHTLCTPEDGDGADGFIVVNGCNVNFDEDGNFINIMDAGWIEMMILEAAKAQGMGVPKYIKPGADAKYSNN